MTRYKTTPDGTFPFTEEEEAIADANLLEMQKTMYISNRQEEYPPITDYIDGIVKGDTAQVQAYIDACLAVKAKYPKPE